MAGIGATYTQLVPISELHPGELSSFRNDFVKAVVGLAVKGLQKPDNELVVRDILPYGDLDYSFLSWAEFTGATANTYETMSTGTMSTDRWVGIYGVACDFGEGDPWSVSAVKFNVGGGDRMIWELECLKLEDNRVGFSKAGVVIPPSQPYTISRYVINTGALARIVLRGIVVEPRGKTISP